MWRELGQAPKIAAPNDCVRRGVTGGIGLDWKRDGAARVVEHDEEDTRHASLKLPGE